MVPHALWYDGCAMQCCLGARLRAFRFLTVATGVPILVLLMAAACTPNTRPLWPTLTGEPPAAPYVPAAFTAD